jgi:hypothetical protein
MDVSSVGENGLGLPAFKKWPGYWQVCHRGHSGGQRRTPLPGWEVVEGEFVRTGSAAAATAEAVDTAHEGKEEEEAEEEEAEAVDTAQA